MRKSKFTEEQIVGILKEIESGSSITAVSRKHNVQPQSIYRWKEKYGGMQSSDVRRLKTLEEENLRLKRMVANMALENEAMKDLIQKKL